MTDIFGFFINSIKLLYIKKPYLKIITAQIILPLLFVFQRCKPSAIPIILESLQVLSAVAFHHLSDLLQYHVPLVADVLCVMLQHEHQDVVSQSARTISIIGDAIQKLGMFDHIL